MPVRLKKWIIAHVAMLMMLSPAAGGTGFADDHVVSPSELHKRLLEASSQHDRNLAKVTAFFSTESAAQALQKAGVSSDRVQRAVSSLDSEELARLASRVDKVQKDFAGGALNNQELTYIVIALATAVIILVIVAAD
jgi:hypothetical protein